MYKFSIYDKVKVYSSANHDKTIYKTYEDAANASVKKTIELLNEKL